MDIRNLLDQAIKLADLADNFIPMASNVTAALKMGNGVLDVIDGIKEQATPADQPRLQEARAKLAASVKAKAAATSARLRG